MNASLIRNSPTEAPRSHGPDSFWAPPKFFRAPLACSGVYSGGRKAALPRPGNDREKQRFVVLSSRPLPTGWGGGFMPGLRIRVLGDFEAQVGTGLALSLPARK